MLDNPDNPTATLEPGGPVTTTDNPPAPPATDGPESPAEAPQPPARPELYRELGYSSDDDLRQAHMRQRQQVDAGRQEYQRLRDEQAQRDARYQEQLMTLQNQLLLSQQPQRQVEPTLSLEQAIAEWTNGDGTALARYEAQQQARQRPAQPGMTPEQVDQRVNQQMEIMTRPSVYAEWVSTAHPELKDTSSELYKRVLNDYDAYIAQQGGYYTFALPNDPTAIRQVPDPSGYGMKNVDLRVVRELAWQIKAQMNLERGRQEEFQRQHRPAVGGTTRPATPAADHVDAWALFSRQEQEVMRQLSSTNSQPETWPRDPQAMAKYRYDRMSDDEKARRRATAGR